MSALSLAERSGDLILRASTLTLLAIAAIRPHDKSTVRSLAVEAEVASEFVPSFGGAAKGCLAWLAWQDGRPKDVVVLATEAGEVSRTRRCPLMIWKWVYIWPLVAAHLQDGAAALAVTAASELLETSQQRLPDELRSIVESACLSWDRGESHIARRNLALALEMAHELRYF